MLICSASAASSRKTSTVAGTEGFATIVEKANAAIKNIAEQEAYDVIIQDAVTVSPRVDITDKVISALGR